jgi:plastocyanin
LRSNTLSIATIVAYVPRMMRRVVILAVSVVLLGACGGGASDERQVFVDFSSDEVTMFLAENFPKSVSVLPGQTLVFKQTWTGEPHTVTGGNFATGKLREGRDLLTLFVGYDELRAQNPNMVNPEDAGDASVAEFAAALKAAQPADKRDEVLAAWDKLRTQHGWPDLDNPPATSFADLSGQIDEVASGIFDRLLYAFDDESGGLAQNVAQPCFLAKGLPPKQASRACSPSQQKQPDFDGTQSFYNSGILKYEGSRGNTFRLPIADDAKPGTYFFYCAVHGPGQMSEVRVQKPGTRVASASAVRHEALEQARAKALPLEETYRKAVSTGKATVNGEEVSGPFAGLPTSVHGSINEFVPKEIRAKAGEPITWKMIGASHTISFDVPPYLPIIEFGKTRFRMNPKIEHSAGGAPAPPEENGDGEPPTKIDGGSYSGSGFWSTGLVGGGDQSVLEYTLRITKPGTYPYACLIHPRMIGKVIVS